MVWIYVLLIEELAQGKPRVNWTDCTAHVSCASSSADWSRSA
jgi:hypothetical protein